MKSMTILGAETRQIPAGESLFPGLDVSTPSRSAYYIWRIAVVGFGRYRDDPRAKTMEFEAQNRDELRKTVEHASHEDYESWMVGD